MVSAARQVEFESSGGRLVATGGKDLPLKSVEIASDAKGGIARVVLRQRFSNPHEEPLAVTYSLALPADAAVSGFAFTIGNERVVGEVDKKAKARERFERAIVEGRTASLLEQERSSVFTQEVGNVPPHTEVICEVTLDQKLAWLAEGAWEWRFPTCVAPRYLGAQGRVPDAAEITVDVADTTPKVAMSLSLEVRDAATRVESPSHSISQSAKGPGVRAELDPRAAATLDRDLVMRWAVATPKVGLSLDVARVGKGALEGSSFGLLTLVPPSLRQRQTVRRDLIVLLDTSGSMSGEPLEQARRVVSAMIDTLDENDTIELIEFSTEARRWKSKPVEAKPKQKREALGWLGKLRASGGTEMRTGILEALASLDDEAQRQVVVVTDGLIGFEHEVVRAIAEKCPPSCRVHTVGVGSGVNRSLTAPAARAGRGAEVVISLGEDPERAARRLVARTDAPTVVELQLSGNALLEHAPMRIPDLFGASPAMVALKLRPEGGELIVRGRTAEGEYVEKISVPALENGQGSGALAALFARELVEDLELQVASGLGSPEIESRIENLGLVHQISTRLTSWVAVSTEVTVDPLAATRHETMPQALPHGMSVGGLGLRSTSAAPGAMAKSIAPQSIAMAGPAPSGGMAFDRADFGGAPRKAKKLAGKMEPSPDAKEAEKREVHTRSANMPSAPPPPPAAPKGAMPTTPETERAQRSRLEDQRKLQAPSFEEAESYTGDFDEGGADDAIGAAADKSKDAKAKPKEPAKPSPIAVALWLARVVLFHGRELVFELVAADERLWDPTQTIELTLADGSTLRLSADLAKTTRALRTHAGLVLRVALTLPEGVTAQPVSAKIGDLQVQFRG